MNYTDILQTNKLSSGMNYKKGILVHHTGSGTYDAMKKYLSGNKGRDRDVSVHYVIGEQGEVAKIGEEWNVLWHGGMGKYPTIENGKEVDMNRYFIGIEVVSNGKDYTEEQRKTLPLLLRDIQERNNCSLILRHADIAGYRGKWDIGEDFFSPLSWEEYVDTIFTPPMTERDQRAIQAVMASLSSAWFAEGASELAERHKKEWESLLPKN
jgi:N-acetyl-anhydromuramyl-L-alanine amidase AmpD